MTAQHLTRTSPVPGETEKDIEEQVHHEDEK
jgi:hypothetical protein